MMKKLINFSIILVSCLALGCKKDAKLTVLEPIGFDSSIKASTGTVALSAATDDASVITFSWPAVKFPIKAAVTYTLQVDVPADTVGTTAWANAKNIVVGDDVLSKAYKGSDLNTLAISMGIEPNTAGKLVFRTQATMDRNTYTRGLAITISPYQVFTGFPALYVPGDYQGWSPGTATSIVALQSNKIYEGYVYFPAGGTFNFKFTSDRDWNHINYGYASEGKLSTDGLAGGLVVPGPGYYELSANTNNLTWTYTKTTWSILGDASPGGWSTDTQMTYDVAKQVWTLTCDMSASGSFKFRANNAWNIDFGITKDGKLTYADSPVYGYNGTLDNLSVPSSGNYTITLDLHDANNYKYTLHKN
ncbi:SusE domain-containing protein [Mucilaginibacter sp. R-33]|uniref:SusE domain-containing protein n=1 Tax=Mucilaginibacter sp. R-33 TaxID=3416711 RepID=UPI003CF99A85